MSKNSSVTEKEVIWSTSTINKIQQVYIYKNICIIRVLMLNSYQFIFKPKQRVSATLIVLKYIISSFL